MATFRTLPASDVPITRPHGRPVAERFFEKVRDEGGCWRWTAALNSGGGGVFSIKRSGAFVYARYYAHTLVFGNTIPSGRMRTTPACGNRWCINPAHAICRVPKARVSAAYRCQTLDARRSGRFWKKVEKGPGCWLWRASVNEQNGYGYFCWDSSANVTAPIAAWRLTHGVIPAGQLVLHRCGNALCVNPDHLYLGTQADAVVQRAANGRHGSHKLREAGKAEVRRLAAEGLAGTEIARRVGVSPFTVWRLVKGKPRAKAVA